MNNSRKKAFSRPKAASTQSFVARDLALSFDLQRNQIDRPGLLRENQMEQIIQLEQGRLRSPMEFLSGRGGRGEKKRIELKSRSDSTL